MALLSPRRGQVIPRRRAGRAVGRRHGPGWSGLAVLAVMATIASACSLVGSQASPYTVSADFASAVGLYPSSAVTVLGVRVGTVVAVTNQGDHVLVKMSIDHHNSLAADSNAAIVGQSLLGQRYIQFSPAYTGGPKMHAGDTVPLAHTTVPVSTDQLLSSLKKFLGGIDPSNAANVVTNLAQLLGGQGQNLNNLIHNATGTLSLLAAKGNDLGHLVGTLAQLTGTLKTHDAAITQLIDDYNSVSGVLAANQGPLADAINNLNQAAVQVNGVLSPNLTGLQQDVSTITTLGRTIDANLNYLDQLGQSSPRLFQAAKNAYDPVHNWLNLNLASAPGQTDAIIEARLRDRLAGICRRLEAKVPAGPLLDTLTQCGNPNSGYFNALLPLIPNLLNQLPGSTTSATTTGGASATNTTPSALFSKGLSMIPGLGATQKSAISNAPVPGDSTATTAASTAGTSAPSLNAPGQSQLPPLPRTQGANGGNWFINWLEGIL
ncbi:MAG: MCE family protein [Acidimicrobiales bacterium]